MRDRRLCLTCGGPAAICAAADRCVGFGTGLTPPRLDDERYTRTQPTLTSFGWRPKALLTAALWAFGMFAASRSGGAARPLLVFLGVPYVVASAALTWQVWRPHRTR